MLRTPLSAVNNSQDAFLHAHARNCAFTTRVHLQVALSHLAAGYPPYIGALQYISCLFGLADANLTSL